MEYPRDFPEHLKRPVDAVIHAAEIAFIDEKQAVAPSRFEYEAQRLIFRYVEAVFFGFAAQAVQAGKEGRWNGERIRRALDEFLDYLAHRACFDKYPNLSGHQSEWFKRDLKTASKDWVGWRAVHEGLRQVAELRALPAEDASIPSFNTPRRGYRKEIREWIAREELDNLDQAARRLALSKSALKSIMSSTGRLRCSMETLNRVLKEIGCAPNG
jgi:hypothetical protein